MSPKVTKCEFEDEQEQTRRRRRNSRVREPSEIGKPSFPPSEKKIDAHQQQQQSKCVSRKKSGYAAELAARIAALRENT